MNKKKITIIGAGVSGLYLAYLLEDKKLLSAHPEYGIDTSSYRDKVLFSATEFSYDNGGYIEGAILLAQKISKKLHNA